jgi:hypothetical protein
MKNLMRFFVVCMLLSATTYAGNYTWTGTTNSSWNTNTNWNPNGIPNSSDTITINTTTTSLVLTGKQTIKRLVMTNDTLNLGGDTLEITGSAGFNGGHIINGVCYPQATGLLSFAGTTFGAEVKAKGQIKLNGSTFNSTAYFEHIGSAAGTGSGGNTFNGTTTLKNAGTSTFRLAGSANDTFNGDVTVISAATSGSGSMQLSAGGSSYFNGNIVVNSTTVFGISFSSAGAGSSVLASGKTISIGGSGFVGTLLMRNFTQLGTTSQTLSFNGILNIMNSEFNGSLTSSSTNLLLTGNNFHGVCSFTKTGISSDYSAGGNHFYQDLTIQNNVTNTAIIRMASTNGDVYEGNVTLNTSTGFIQMAYADTSDFYGDISINSTKVNFNSGAGVLHITGTSAQSFQGTAGYSIGKIIVNNTSNGAISCNQPITIDSVLVLTQGLLSTDSTNILTLKASAVCNTGSSISFMDGPMKKIGNTAFTFPTGDGGRYLPLHISAPLTSTDAFTCCAYATGSNNGWSLDSTLMLPDTCTYWKLNRNVGSSNVFCTLYKDDESCIDNDSTNYRVASWSGTKWMDFGNGAVASTSVTSANQLTTYNALTMAKKRVGNNCVSAVNVIPDTIFQETNFALTDTIIWLKFMADSATSIMRFSIQNQFPIAQLDSFSVFSGSCNELSLIGTYPVFGPGDSISMTHIQTMPDSLYFIAIAGRLNCTGCAQLNNGAFTLAIKSGDYLNITGGGCFDENGCGLGQNMGFDQFQFGFSPLAEQPFNPGNGSYTACSWLTANGTPQLGNNLPAAPNAAFGDVTYARMYSINASEAIYQPMTFLQGETYLLRYAYRRDQNLPASYTNYTISNTVDNFNVVLSNNVATSSQWNLVSTILASWAPVQNVNQVTNINSAAWTQVNTCFVPTVNYSQIAIYPSQNSLGVLSIVNVDNFRIYHLQANAGLDAAICLNSNYQLGNLSNTCAASGEIYSWSPATGLSATNIANPIFTPPGNGTYTFTFTVTDPLSGCFVTDQVTIQVGLTVDISASPLVICNGQPTTLTAGVTNGTAPYTYMWSTGATTSSITVSTAGTYTVTATDVNGCTGLQSITIVASTNPPVATISGSTIPCVNGGSNVPYSIVNPNPNYFYTWSSIFPAPNGWNIQNPLLVSQALIANPNVATSVLVNFPNTGGYTSNYILQVITADQNGCTSTSLYQVNWCCTGDIQTNHDWRNESASNVTPPAPNETVVIRGKFIVDVPTSWTGVDITMDPGAEIIVENGVQLSIRGSHLSPCESFWKSITVDGGWLRVQSSEIEGANTAIDVLNGGGYIINQGNTFADNFISLRVTGPTIGNLRLFNNSTITRTYLYDVYTDYNGQSPGTCYATNDYPSHGIFIREAGYLLIGASGTGLRNTIEEVRVGIESMQTDLDVMNTSFLELKNRPCIPNTDIFRRTGIYFHHGVLRTLNVNTALPNHCIFDDCWTGILAFDAKVDLQQNVMDNVNFGIRYFNPPSSFVGKPVINYNTITTSFAGISLNGQGLDHHTEISHNIITGDGTGFGGASGFGINVQDVPVIGRSGNFNVNTIVANNGFRNGILFNGEADFVCSGNNISLSNSNTAILNNGINVVAGSNFSVTNQNNVTDNLSTNQSSGFRIRFSGGLPITNFVTCNSASSCQRDFWFEGVNLDMDWASNTMNSGGVGLRLDNALLQRLTPQPWNWWCGTFTNNLIVGGGNFNFINWFQDPVISGICTNSPTVAQIGGSISANIIPVADPGGDPGCPRGNEPVSAISDIDRFILSDSATNVFDETILWQYKRLLAGKLAVDTSLIAADTLMSYFWETQEGDVVQLAMLMHKVLLIDSVNRNYLSVMEPFVDSINTNRILYNFNDSLLHTELNDDDSIRLVEESAELLQHTTSLQLIVDSLSKIAQAKIDSVRNDCLAAYTEFTPQTDLGYIETEIFKLLLSYGYGSTAIPDESDSAQIADYAYLCMTNYGPAVSYIRSLYYQFYGEMVDDDDVCDLGWRIRKEETVKSMVKASIVPNPAMDQVTIKLNSVPQEEVTIQVMAASGELVYSSAFSSTDLTLSLHTWKPGVYFVHLRGNTLSIHEKLVVVK